MDDMNGKIGVGIIGLSAGGGWAALSHVPALRSMPDRFEIVGLSASSAESAKAAADKHDVAFHTDSPAELAARSDVDLLAVTVKVPYHRELVEAAAKAGKMVYCEWPLARDAAEAEALVDLTAKTGIRNFIGLQARSAPPVRYLHDLVAQGAIGKVLSSTIIGSGGPPWGGAATSSSVYATDRATGAQMLTIPFGHTIDAMTWALGDFDQLRATMALRRKDVHLSDTGGIVQATGADQIAVSGLLTDGAVASLHYRGGLSKGTNFLWEINGTEGDIVVTGGIGHIQFGQIRIQLATDGGDLIEMPVPDDYIRLEGTPAHPSFAVAHAYRAIADDVQSGGKSVPDFADALKLHHLLARIEESAGF
jgi:predicted dehydrogenase